MTPAAYRRIVLTHHSGRRGRVSGPAVLTNHQAPRGPDHGYLLTYHCKPGLPRRLSFGVSKIMTVYADDHPCTIEELAALKFEPVGGASDPMMGLEAWLERAKQEYITMKFVLPIIESSDADFERRIRDNEDPEGFCKAMQALIENVQEWREYHRCALETMECAWVRLMAVLARFIDDGERIEAQQRPNWPGVRLV